MLFFYWAGFAGITFGMRTSSYINLVLLVFMTVMTDNALEAAGQAEGERRIQIRADVFHEFVAVRIRNTISVRKPCEVDLCGMKAVKKTHMGIGLENVRQTLEKYGGGMMTEIAEGEFIVNLTIPDSIGTER